MSKADFEADLLAAKIIQVDCGTQIIDQATGATATVDDNNAAWVGATCFVSPKVYAALSD